MLVSTAQAIAHEAGHTFGLGHVIPFTNDNSVVELMNDDDRSGDTSIPVASFLDVSQPLRANPEVFQNSFQYLIQRFGENPITTIKRDEEIVGRFTRCDRFTFADFLSLFTNWRKKVKETPEASRSDHNGNGVVDFGDLLIISSNYGEERVPGN